MCVKVTQNDKRSQGLDFSSLEGGTFPLSDASSLLLRLELAGVDVKERARELVSLWENHNDTFVRQGCFTL